MILQASQCLSLIQTSPSRVREKGPYRLRLRLVFSKSNRDSDLSGSPSIKHGRLRKCEVYDLHGELVPYKEAWAWQKEIVKGKKAMIERGEDCPDTVIVLQHYPVCTMGTGSSQEFLKFDLNNAPFDVHRIERGGEVTYHGPGQLVMYPIINLRNHEMDLHWYLRKLEEVVIRVLSSTFGIKATRIPGLTGVWVENGKLAAIGIKVSSWITYHGLALNVTTDLAPFRWIVPCGIRDRQVGSIQELLGKAHPDHNEDNSQLIEATSKALIKEFCEVFQLQMCPQTTSRLLDSLHRDSFELS